jgi:hypothetical protein
LSCFFPRYTSDMLRFMMCSVLSRTDKRVKCNAIDNSECSSLFRTRRMDCGNWGERDLFCELRKTYCNKLLFDKNLRFEYI